MILLLFWNPDIELNQAGTCANTLHLQYILSFTASFVILCTVALLVQGYVFVEHYAGGATMTETIRKEVGPSARLDLEYHRGMDILTAAGFSCLP